jgi:hypothetical protein
MSEILQLSLVPAERLKTFVDTAKSFPWDNPERAEPIIANLCVGFDRERELLMIGVRERVPAAIKRSFDRSPDHTPAQNMKLVWRHLADRVFIDQREAQWLVETLAGTCGFAPMPKAMDWNRRATAAAPPEGFVYRSAQREARKQHDDADDLLDSAARRLDQPSEQDAADSATQLAEAGGGEARKAEPEPMEPRDIAAPTVGVAEIEVEQSILARDDSGERIEPAALTPEPGAMNCAAQLAETAGAEARVSEPEIAEPLDFAEPEPSVARIDDDQPVLPSEVAGEHMETVDRALEPGHEEDATARLAEADGAEARAAEPEPAEPPRDVAALLGFADEEQPFLLRDEDDEDPFLLRDDESEESAPVSPQPAATPAAARGPLKRTIPEEVEEESWCWSGCLGGVWWMWAHGMKAGPPVLIAMIALSFETGWWWLTLLVLIGVSVFLGLKGNHLAWEHRQFDSIDEFRAVQRAWASWGLIVSVITVAAVVWMMFAESGSGAMMPHGAQPENPDPDPRDNGR